VIFILPCFETNAVLFFWSTIRASRPADFSYKHDAKHNSMLIVARIWNDLDDEALVQEVSEALFSSKAGTQFTSLLVQKN
jgi:general transcription factor 3C polypeptide 4